MFKVQADSLDEYFDADPARKEDLQALDALIRSSLYTSVVQDGAPITDRYKGSLGELKTGRGNFSFVTFDQLDQDAVVALLKDIDKTLGQDPIGALQYGTYRIVSSSVTAP